MEFILLLPVLLLSVVVHEYAHGWVALTQGDDTAFKLGRLTLNPIPHIDPVGSLLVPAMLWFTGAGFLFGWAKPVPVRPRNFRDYRKGDILVSLAGVAANLVLAVVFTLFIVLVIHLGRWMPSLSPALDPARDVAWFGVLINLILVFFNLIPIPPLDGSHVLYHVLPPKLGARYRQAGRFGMLILIGIMVLVPQVFRYLLWPVTALQGVAETLVGMWT